MAFSKVQYRRALSVQMARKTAWILGFGFPALSQPARNELRQSVTNVAISCDKTVQTVAPEDDIISPSRGTRILSTTTTLTAGRGAWSRHTWHDEDADCLPFSQSLKAIWVSYF